MCEVEQRIADQADIRVRKSRQRQCLGADIEECRRVDCADGRAEAAQLRRSAAFQLNLTVIA